jgi:hypothetical protein
MGNREASRKAGLAHVRRWQCSGQTRAAYCADHGLNVTTFDGWRRRAKAAVTMVPLTVREDATRTTSPAGATIAVCCRNGIRLELGHDVAATWLADLLRALGAC